MHFTKLPLEILDRILWYLPRHSKQQCLVVCKAWYVVTLPRLNRYIQLQGSENVVVLYKKLFDGGGGGAGGDRIKGSDIRCLSLAAEKASDRYIVRRDILVRILNACTSLQTLQLMYDSNQFLEYMYQTRHELLNIDSLTNIYIPLDVVNRVIRANEFTAIYHFRQKITQLPLNVHSDTFRDMIPGNMNIGLYLSHFVLLRSLSLQFDTKVILHDILSACPQLETLRLFGSNILAFNAQLQMYSRDKPKPFPLKSQLKRLTIDTCFVNQDLLEYMAENIDQFYQLTLCGSLSHNVNNLINAFSSYKKNDKREKQLIVKCIRFESNFTFSDDLIQHVVSCFYPSVNRLELAECNFHEIMTENNNILLDFTDLNLEYLSIDIQDILECSASSINKTSLEVTVNTATPTTMYYQRKSKWKPENIFEAKLSNLYKHNTTRNKRVKSELTCVLKIKANSIHYLRLYCQNQDKNQKFAQIINLQS